MWAVFERVENMVGKGINILSHYWTPILIFFINHSSHYACFRFNSFPNNKFLNWFKLEAFINYNFILAEKMEFVLGMVENIIGKGENAGLHQHFLLFPLCFYKTSILGSLKVGIVW